MNLILFRMVGPFHYIRYPSCYHLLYQQGLDPRDNEEKD